MDIKSHAVDFAYYLIHEWEYVKEYHDGYYYRPIDNPDADWYSLEQIYDKWLKNKWLNNKQ